MQDYQEAFQRVKRERGLQCNFHPSAATSARAIGECTLYEHRIGLYHESQGTISYRYIHPGGGDADAVRGRTGTKELARAFVFANEFLRERATEYLRSGSLASAPAGLSPATSTIRHSFEYVRANLRKDYKAKQWRELLRIFYCAAEIWDLDRLYTSLSGDDISRYIEIRTEVGLTLPKEFSNRPRIGPCKLITAVNDLRMLGAVFRKLQTVADRHTRERPFDVNPFSWLLLPAAEKALRSKPSSERYEVLMRFVDEVDPRGRLRLALAFARWLGRRIGAISQLARADLRLSTDAMLEAVHDIERRGHQAHDGIQSESFAFGFEQGAVLFAAAHDKKGYHRLVPISSTIRSEVDLYLNRNPDLAGEGPLFPSDDDSSQATTVVRFIEMLHDAEALAREAGHQREVPLLYNSVFHGFRGLRATELENLQHRAAHVNFIVGWSCKVGSAKDVHYVTHDATLLYAAVEGWRPVEVERAYQQVVEGAERENERLREQNAELIRRLEMLEQRLAHDARFERIEAMLERLAND